jgi:hypothetical protein
LSLPSWLPALLTLALDLGGGIGLAAAQSSPSRAEVRDQLDQVVGNRVESAVILGGQEVPQGGLFGWQFNGVDASVLKYPWSVELGDPRPLGPGELAWRPVILGTVGVTRFTNHFRDGPLAGSQSTYETYSATLGAGPRLWLLPEVSVLPAFSLAYAYTENDFDAGRAQESAVAQAVDGRLVNWHAHTLTFVPSLRLRYRQTFGPLTVDATSSYAYFATVPVARSTEAYSFTSDSQVWSNRLELEVVTPWAVAGWPLVAGGFGGRAELGGGLRDSLKTDHVYSVGGHVALDPGGRLWKLTQIGVAGSYFWSGAFTGWTLGVDWSVGF